MWPNSASRRVRPRCAMKEAGFSAAAGSPQPSAVSPPDPWRVSRAASANSTPARHDPGAEDLPEGAVAMSLEALTEQLKTRSEEHTSELQSLMRISYAVFCLKKKKQTITLIE